MGSPSTNLPDILAANNEKDILLAIEAKAGTYDNLCVHAEEAYRCLDILNMFEKYGIRKVILAFKFLQKTRNKRTKKYEYRKLKRYYKDVTNELNAGLEFDNIRCRYDGKTFVINKGVSEPRTLLDYPLLTLVNDEQTVLE